MWCHSFITLTQYIQWKSIQWKTSWTAREKMKVKHVALKERFSEGCTYNKPFVFFLCFGIILIRWIGWYWKKNVSYSVSWNNLPSSCHKCHVCHKMTSSLAQTAPGAKCTPSNVWVWFFRSPLKCTLPWTTDFCPALLDGRRRRVACDGFAAAAEKYKNMPGSRFQRIICVGEKKRFIMVENSQGLSAGWRGRARWVPANSWRQKCLQ